MAVVREALSIGVLAGIVLVVGLGIWSCAPGRRRAREAELRGQLTSLRSMIVQYRGDHGRGPAYLEDLVRSGYLRKIPTDPITGSDHSWIEVRTVACSRARLADVRSGAPGRALDGSEYRSW